MSFNPTVKIYDGYGTPNKFFIIGHVFNNYTDASLTHRNNLWYNFKTLYNLFNVHVLSGIKLNMEWKGRYYQTQSEADGFFKFEIDLNESDISAYGWQEYKIYIDDVRNASDTIFQGKIFIPEEYSRSIISDIDDTIVKSYSTKTYKKLLELMRKNATERSTFEHMSEFLHQFKTHSYGHTYNYFYVSSSEWNLYDYIKHVFLINKIPDGILLLNTIKSLREFYKTGYSGHEGKFFRIARLFISFPHMKFLLIGDNSQRDVQIYASIAQKYPDQVLGILIRDIRKSKSIPAQQVLQQLSQKNIKCYQFKDAHDARRQCIEWELLSAHL